MNKLITLFATAASLIVASVVPFGQAHAGEVLDKVLQSKTLTVAVGTDWGAISHLDKNHELVGYDVDIVKQIAKSLGVEPKFVTPSWDVITSGMWEGRWDIAMGQMVPTEARAKVLNFPAVNIWVPSVAVVHKDSKATQPSDLEGKVVGVTGGSSDADYANHSLTPAWTNAKPIQYQFKAGQVKTYGTANIAYDDLRLGDGVRLDAVLTDALSAQEVIKAGYPLKILKPALYSGPGAIAILRGDKEFSEKIAAVVNEMKDDGTLSELSKKWYGADYSKEQ
ncbi:transporter substrate-binding domain-containing protein [Mesorhizobium sp. M0800]|uniref:transporter substrate-binding domain-containing protein n=1 Tax=Mesorhizobium sp. M0800 TaxID=2957000 RepID=UPI00333C1911